MILKITVKVILKIISRCHDFKNNRNSWLANQYFLYPAVATSLVHFSHPISQGTKKYPQTALEQQVESMGAHLNAYTSREHTAYFMKTLAKDLPKGTCMQPVKSTQ